MEPRPLYVAFVWNQHQPFYQDTETNEYIMPWMRLHATKDYYQMAAILEQYPQVKQTFNLTPSLLKQIEDYLDNGCLDHYMKVMKPVSELTRSDRSFLLQHFFDIQWDRVIARYPRYRELLILQGRRREPQMVDEALSRFLDQDYRDLQVWFNLAWIDPEMRAKDAFLSGLEKKERGFSEEEREELMRCQMKILQEVVPVHRRLKEKGRIELVTTPFYHPIMPLIIDTRSAYRASPGLPLPERFGYREDAYNQLELALKQYRRLFGGKPEGVWPPEQAISPETVSIFSDLGFSWTISDEQILAKSMEVEIVRDGYGHVLNPEVLYQPYRVMGEGGDISMVFRDHHLSDRIGFEYQHFNGQHAAEDLVHRLHRIRENLAHSPGNYLVTLSLDGENAWEWYPDDKRTFLHSLYRRLGEDPLLRCVTVSEFLTENPPRRKINHLYTGSWVDHSLTRWIGTENKNMMWDLLTGARARVEEYSLKADADEKKLERALKNIYIAEGSDYHWWVDSMPYYLSAPFEALFRKHLANVYHSLSISPPAELYKPLVKPGPGEAAWKRDPLSGPLSMVPAFSDEGKAET